MVAGTLVVGGRPSWVNKIGPLDTFEVASLGLVTECIAGDPMSGRYVLDGVEFSPGTNR